MRCAYPPYENKISEIARRYEGVSRRLPFGREPGLLRGRRRAPLTRSREERRQRKTACRRTEPFTERIYSPLITIQTIAFCNGGCASLTHPTSFVNRAFVGRVSEAHPPDVKAHPPHKKSTPGSPCLTGWCSSAAPVRHKSRSPSTDFGAPYATAGRRRAPAPATPRDDETR